MSTATTSNHAAVEPRGFFARWVLDFHNRTVLFRVGNFLFTTYAFLAGAAFLMGFAAAVWFNAMSGLDAHYISRLNLFLLIPGILVGLRAFSVMLEWRELFRRPLQTLVKPGYMLHGGLAGGTVMLFVIASITGYPVLALLDAPAFAMPLGESIARLGCFVYGCCWGRPTTSRFGVRYTSKQSKVVRCAPHLENVKIHPAQLYALVVYLGLFAVFYAILPYLPFDGFLTAVYLIAHSLIRYSLEYFRQDDRGKLWGKLTHTNLYSGIMIVAGLGILAWGYAGSPTFHELDMSYRFVHLFGDMSILPWIAMCGLVFGAAYGVHYKKVGSWISTPSSGMKPHVDEMSMGAVQRMEKSAAGDQDDDDQG